MNSLLKPVGVSAASATKVPISVVVNTLNEERNLPFALRSVHSWADEIVVCDMHSDDKTVEIAKQYGANVCFHERVGTAELAREFAISKTRNDWILVLDADELVSYALSQELSRIVRSDECDVVRMPRLNYLLGAPIESMGWAPDVDTQGRFFKRTAVNFTGHVHSGITPKATARIHAIRYRPGLALVHFNYVDLEQFVEKLNRYTSIEAKRAFSDGKRASFREAAWLAVREWLSRYLKHGGLREGWRGLYLTAMMSTYRLALYGKLTELQTGNDHQSVLAHYREEAERYLKAYERTGGA
jgi:(heptosyl)LPS beta-1,4-glucosyltransferase